LFAPDGRSFRKLSRCPRRAGFTPDRFRWTIGLFANRQVSGADPFEHFVCSAEVFAFEKPGRLPEELTQLLLALAFLAH
jgi:hypothetical protein